MAVRWGILCLWTALALGVSGQGATGRARMADAVPAEVESLYDQGVQFLLDLQTSDPDWNSPSSTHSAVTAFALLAVLAKGENIYHPRVAEFTASCIDALLAAQHPATGYIGTSMYNHGFVTLGLAEAYGVVPDPRIGPALVKAVDLILSAQAYNPKKAWRYTPQSNDADSTVTGCQLVALFAARNAGIPVPDAALRQGLEFLESCRGENGAYGYVDDHGGRPTLTAIGVLCHYLATREVSDDMEQSLAYLKRRMSFRDQHYPFYFEYYMSQALFQANYDLWEEWNQRNVRYLRILQAPDGSWDGNHGKVYCTSAALLSLALNYRYMPIYERF